ncbi:MAG: HNH endonuclease [Loktanella sp.]|nr:HNH endonuclease [Loktanella sp.]
MNKETTLYGFTYEQLSRKFKYDPLTGALYGKTGRRITAQDLNGYIKVMMPRADKSQHQIYGHRLAWFLHHGWIDPDLHSDHINGDPSDNRIKNLRLIPQDVNNRNSKMNKRNKLGVPNVCSSPNGKYRVHVKGHTYGYFDELEHADIVASEMRRILGFHPNHGRAA